MNDIWHYSFNAELKDNRNKWCPVQGGEIPQGKTFWFLRLTTFEDFLKRRSEVSGNPKKHFPTLETYAKLTCERILKYEPFDRTRFIDMYNRLKRGKHHSAKSMLKDIALPEKWYRLATLNNDGICWLADDGISASLLNLASAIDSRGIGKIMLVELVRYLCEHGYKYFDAGISGDYGGYKKRIFLDSICG